MQQHIKANVSSYLTDAFIDCLEKFQEIVRIFTIQIDKISKNIDSSVYLGSNKSLQIKKTSSLSLGHNKNIAVKIIVLRVLWNKFNTFILTTQKFPVADLNEIFCLIIDTPNFNAPFNESWKNDLGSMATLFVKEPFVEDNIINDLKLIKVVIENCEIKVKPKYKGDIKQIKTYGNELYNKGDYINAFYSYECALCCCFDFSDTHARSILYNNSAASLFKLNLFDSSLKYCSITLKLDRNYYKSYFWKIQCLLQKKQFGQVPNLLIVLQPKILPQEFHKLNTKYSIYLANSLGMYNWHHISQIRKLKSEVSVCDYASKSIGMRVQDDHLVYYALDKIAKNQILIISKPMIFDKKSDNNSQLLCDSIVKCFNFQRSISNSLKDLLSPFPKDHKQNKTEQIKQIQKNIKKYLMRPKDITSSQTDSIGLWPQIMKFSHSCHPNCSFVHFQNIMLISASTNIKKGEHFTLDFASTVSQPNRKQFLLRKFNIYCKCTICEWKNWPNTKMMTSIEQLANITDLKSNINLIKHVYWELIASQDLSNIENGLLQKSHNVVVDQVSWTDLILAIQLIRKGPQKLQKALMEILVSGFRCLLKIPDQVGEKIIKNLS